MTFGFGNLMMLFALAGLLVPPIIHLLNRRRHDVVDWGAMQFLQVGETVRRKVLLEELLLMALRMGVIALLVLGLAAPFVAHPLLADMAGGAGRDVVLIFDGSYSMGYADGLHPTPFEEARKWASNFVSDQGAGLRAMVLVARPQPTVIMPWTEDRELLLEKIAALPVPRGNSDWPRAVDEAHRLLRELGGKRRAEIIVLRDDQLQGWADGRTLQHWEALGKKLAGDDRSPNIEVVTLGPEKPKQPANFAVAPLETLRPLAWPGQRVTFRTSLSWLGAGDPLAPQRLRIEVDGQPADDIPLPTGAWPRGQVPLTFSHRFASAGSHLVSVILEPEVSREKRSTEYRLHDTLPGDNRQDLALDVIRDLSIVLVDGGTEPSSSTFFLAKALSQSPDARLTDGIQARVMPAKDFTSETIAKNRPRVLVLADVATLTPTQEKAVQAFLDEGGGVLVVPGERVASSSRYYNEQLFQGGAGWLPARLEGVVGELRQPDQAAAPELTRIVHPALDIFREDPNCSLGQARFPRWWKVVPAQSSRVTTWASLTRGDPWLVARDVGKGRVVLCTTPLDRTWNSNLPSVWEFPVLVHEIVYHLAGARQTGTNIKTGEPLRYQPSPGAKVALPASLVLRGPHDEQRYRTDAWPWTLDNPGDAGPYLLECADQPASYFVISADRRESDLTACSADELQKVAARLPLTYRTNGISTPIVPETSTGPQRVDVWWVFLVGMMVLLCAEVWFTRRLALARGPR